MNKKQIELKTTKSNFEQRIISIYGHKNLSCSPYYSNSRLESYEKPIKLTLYYNNGEHIGTWQKAGCWYYG